jgi:phosphohistidine phosphatase
MRTLYLLRHAKSSWDDDTLADHDRPLAPRGVRDAKRIAKHLRSVDAQPDLVLCSSAVRTRQTLDLIKSSLGDAPVRVEDGLYAASADALLEQLRGLPESAHAVLVIGHNPGLHDLAHILAASGPNLEDLAAKFPTGALATLAVDRPTWANLHQRDAELVGYVVARRLH